MLAAMSRRCPEAVLLIDETYREATYGDAPAAPTFAGLSGKVLTCASLSKAYGVPGLRIGWLTVADPRLREQLTLAKFNSSVCCGVLDEFLATRLVSRADQLLASRAALMARPRPTVGRWIGDQDSRPPHLDSLAPQAVADDTRVRAGCRQSRHRRAPETCCGVVQVSTEHRNDLKAHVSHTPNSSRAITFFCTSLVPPAIVRERKKR